MSRAGTPYEVGDIGMDDAAKYLIARGVPKELAEKATQELTGGRFTLLNRVASSFQANEPYEGNNISLFRFVLNHLL